MLFWDDYRYDLRIDAACKYHEDTFVGTLIAQHSDFRNSVSKHKSTLCLNIDTFSLIKKLNTKYYNISLIKLNLGKMAIPITDLIFLCKYIITNYIYPSNSSKDHNFPKQINKSLQVVF